MQVVHIDFFFYHPEHEFNLVGIQRIAVLVKEESIFSH
jgi:hypothetical protein